MPRRTPPTFPAGERQLEALGERLRAARLRRRLTQAVVAARVGELKPNTGKIFRFGNRPGLLVLTKSGEYHAMSGTCTHLDCTVQYKNDTSQVWCACHNGVYDLNGRNVSGPPPRPLQEFEVHVRGDEIVVTRRQEA